MCSSDLAAGLGRTGGSYTFSATERRHQLLISGNTGDSLSVSVSGSSWTNTNTNVTFSGSSGGPLSGTYNVWNSSSGMAQLFIINSITPSFF